MAASLEINNFIGGIITEVSQLNFPPNASLDERNFLLLNDGGRRRRLGIDFEQNYTAIDTGITKGAVYSTYSWEDTGRVDGLTFMVVQVGRKVFFHKSTGTNISSSFFDSITIGVRDNIKFSISTIDDALVIVSGDQDITSVVYENDAFTISTFRLEVRDIFGVSDRYTFLDSKGYVDAFLDRGNNVVYRPESSSNLHNYNLYNQGWPSTNVFCYKDDSTEKSLADPIQYAYDYFFEPFTEGGVGRGKHSKEPVTNIDGSVVSGGDLPGGTGHYPSNADVYPRFVSIGTVKPESVEGFNPEKMASGLGASTQAPQGKYVIDLFNRGSSRTDKSNLTGLPLDSTSGGVFVTAQFAGRVFYAGFSSDLDNNIETDSRSPNLSNYIAFSNLVDYPEDFKRCHQIGDPTNIDNSDLVDTDGGLIRIGDVVRINKLVALSDSLVIFATNGVWQLIGSSDFGFTASNFQIIKVNDKGLLSPESVITTGDALIYWAEDAIYSLALSPDTGFLSSQDISKTTIKSIFDSVLSKETIVGSYDNFDKTARWLYDGRFEIILRVDIGAFSINEFSELPLNTPKIVEYIESRPFKAKVVVNDITVNGVLVEASGEPVEVTGTTIFPETRELNYVTEIVGINPNTIYYTFSRYNNPDFIDWKSQDGVGADAAAYMITGGITGGDTKKNKQVPYIHTHFVRTETGLDENFIPLNQSSCIMTGYWGWANSIKSNKWTTPQQVYKYRRHFIPEDINDFDNGFELVTTKNKLRGRGKAVSLKFETEPLKDLYILGWAMLVTATVVD